MRKIKNLLGGLLLVIILIILDREVWEERPVSQKRNAYVWAWVCILALALLGLMNKCLLAQDSIPVKFGILPPMFAGVTTCDSVANKPEITIAFGVEGELLVIVLRHEKVHAVRMLKFPGGCNAFQARYTKDFKFRVEEESIAYCSSEMKWGKGIEMKRYWLDKIATILFEQAGRFVMSYSQTKALVAYRCGVAYDST